MNRLTILLTTVLLTTASFADSEIVKVKGVELPGIPVRLTDPPVREEPENKRNKQRVPSLAKKKDEGDSTLKSQRPVELEVIPGVNDLVRISRGYLNRIVTPYENPKLLTTNPIDVEYEENVIYVTTNSEKPVGVYITSGDVEGAEAISLTLIPVAIPPREIRLRLAQTTSLLNNPRAKKWEASQDYVSVFKSLFRHLALGEIPNGYALSDDVQGSWACNQTGVAAELGQTLDGHHIRILIFVARNETKGSLELSVADCYKEGVLAAATWPRTILKPGEETEMYLAMRRDLPRQKRRTRPALVHGVQP